MERTKERRISAIRKYLQGLMDESEEVNFLRDLKENLEFQREAAAEALLFMKYHTEQMECKKLCDCLENMEKECLPFPACWDKVVERH